MTLSKNIQRHILQYSDFIKRKILRKIFKLLTASGQVSLWSFFLLLLDYL